MPVFIIRDVRLHGWKPAGDVIEVNFDTPISWVMHCIKQRASKDLVVKFMCHGSPGFLQFCKGITFIDLRFFKEIRGCLKRLELHACLVARIGSNDGNYLCYRLAQTIKASVKASIHTQWYNDGTYVGGAPTGNGVDFGKWNGRVFTWGPKGNIVRTQDFSY